LRHGFSIIKYRERKSKFTIFLTTAGRQASPAASPRCHRRVLSAVPHSCVG
jgi:hypothetical protein